MSDTGKSQAPVSRTRPAGGRGRSQPAETLGSGVRRSSRLSRDAASAPPPGVQESREAPGVSGSGNVPASMTTSKNPDTSGVPPRKPGAREVEADLQEESWGVRRDRESVSTYGSRVMAHLQEYENSGKNMRRLREELRCARSRAESTSRWKKPAIKEEIKQLKKDIKELEERREVIRNNSGPFIEKLQNEDRFLVMAAGDPALKGLQQASQVEKEEDDDEQQNPPGSQKQDPQATCSGLPPEQVTLPPEISSAGEGDIDSDDNTSRGGYLMAQIRQLESPVRLQDYSFGDDLGPEETPGGRKRKPEKKSKKTSEQVNLVYVPLPAAPKPAAGGSHCISPAAHPSPVSAVSPVQGSGESKVISVVKMDTVPACSSRGGVVRETAMVPNSSGGPAAGEESGPGVRVCSPVGGGGDAASGLVASAPVTLEAVAAAERQCKGVNGESSPGPPTKPTGNKVSTGKHVPFIVGATDDKRRHEKKSAKASLSCKESGAGHSVNCANEAEGTNKIRGAVASRWTAGRSIRPLKGPVAGSMEVALPPVPCEAEVISSNTLAGPADGCDNVNANDDTNVDAVSDMVMGDMVVDDVNNVNTVGNIGVGTVGAGPSAPPVATTSVRSYASVAAGVSSSSSGSGDGVLQQRLLEALRRGERTVVVEGREVDLSFWIDRHGLAAFQEQGGGEAAWSLPTAGQRGVRRNVVRLRWRGSDTCPTRAKVVELLLKMNFRAVDIFALIHPYGTPEFDISFVRPEGLEVFWSNYELVKNEPGWRDFAVQAISRQSETKKVTVLTRNESLSCMDIMTWMSRYGEVLGVPSKNRDEFGIWSGAWTFMVKLKRSGGTVTHIPSSAFLGRDRILIYYQGQPKLCHRCGDPTHLSANCRVQKCALCGGEGHLAASCGEIRCHLCGDLGHPFSRCPRSFANAVVGLVGESREVAPAVEGAGRGEGAGGPRKKSQVKSPSKMKRLENRRRSRELGVTLAPTSESGIAAEALGEQDLDEEVRRLEKEEMATSSGSSLYESIDEDGRNWLDNKRKQGAKKKRRRNKKSSTLVQMPKEGQTGSPLIELSNRFQTLNDISSSEEEVGGEVPEVAVKGPTGDVESPSSQDVASLRGETGPESGDEDGGSNADGEATKKDMDTSVSLKRRGGSSSDGDRKEGGKKKAV